MNILDEKNIPIYAKQIKIYYFTLLFLFLDNHSNTRSRFYLLLSINQKKKSFLTTVFY